MRIPSGDQAGWLSFEPLVSFATEASRTSRSQSELAGGVEAKTSRCPSGAHESPPGETGRSCSITRKSRPFGRIEQSRSSQTYAISPPVGDQAGLWIAKEEVKQLRRRRPRTMTQSLSRGPERTNARRVPSGDHVGWYSCAGSDVSRRSPLASGR